MNSEIKLNQKMQSTFMGGTVFFPCEIGILIWLWGNLKLKIAVPTLIATCLSVYLKDTFCLVKAKLVLNTEVKELSV